MKEQLTIEHLAPYLPYKLKLRGNTHGEIYTLESCREIDLRLVESSYATDYFDVKPILRPLSDLTKEIEHNGKKFKIKDMGRPYSNPSSEFYELVRRERAIETYGNYKLESPYNYIVGTIEYWFVQKLLEWHFDVFGLIEKGLAIDINEIESM